MNQTEIEFTRAWWLRCLADKDKLTKWLQKLQRTELGGYSDHLHFMADNAGKLSARERAILTNIADDELKHSHLLIDMMHERGIPVVAEGEPSTYWTSLLANATTLSQYAAANYYGESLAADRFAVILETKETPQDIREVLEMVLPDEVFHRETLQRLASPEDLVLYGDLHAAATARLKGITTVKPQQAPPKVLANTTEGIHIQPFGYFTRLSAANGTITEAEAKEIIMKAHMHTVL